MRIFLIDMAVTFIAIIAVDLLVTFMQLAREKLGREWHAGQ